MSTEAGTAPGSAASKNTSACWAMMRRARRGPMRPDKPTHRAHGSQCGASVKSMWYMPGMLTSSPAPARWFSRAEAVDCRVSAMTGSGQPPAFTTHVVCGSGQPQRTAGQSISSDRFGHDGIHHEAGCDPVVCRARLSCDGSAQRYAHDTCPRHVDRAVQGRIVFHHVQSETHVSGEMSEHLSTRMNVVEMSAPFHRHDATIGSSSPGRYVGLVHPNDDVTARDELLDEDRIRGTETAESRYGDDHRETRLRHGRCINERVRCRHCKLAEQESRQ